MGRLITAHDLKFAASRSRVVLPKGSVLAPSAWEYARASSLDIVFDGEHHDEGHEVLEDARSIIRRAVQEFEAVQGRAPSRAEAVRLVQAIVSRALAEQGQS